jgi:hypothetical protein
LTSSENVMEETKFLELKDLYDELWRDARTLVKDMNKNISAVLFYGVMCFFMALFESSIAVNNYEKVLAGSARWLDWLYLVGGVVGFIVFIVLGVSMLWWYSTLRKRYRRLIEIEKKLGE